MRRISSGKAPYDIACGISDMSTDTVSTLVNVINQGFIEDRDEFVDSFREKKPSSA